jgi:endonuclease YncB( thermonuclease family)
MRAILIMGALAMLAATAFVEDRPHSHIAYVKKVIDGDTIIIDDPSGGRAFVRIMGIDCPENKRNAKCAKDGKKGKRDCAAQIPLGKVAAAVASELLLNKSIILYCDIACMTDKDGRRLHYIQLPGNIDFGLSMVEKGLCEEVSADYPHPRQKEYQVAQQRAKRNKLGLWK